MAIRDADLTESTKKIKHKTLAIVGSEDGSTSSDNVKSMADIIPGSRFEIIEGSGHLPCVDNPEKLSSLILDLQNR
jgi:3-oxoadipate enol-lactonase